MGLFFSSQIDVYKYSNRNKTLMKYKRWHETVKILLIYSTLILLPFPYFLMYCKGRFGLHYLHVFSNNELVTELASSFFSFGDNLCYHPCIHNPDIII